MALACKRSGVVVFVCLLALVAVSAHYSVMLLVEVAERLRMRRAKYSDLGRRLFGRAGELVAALSVILQQSGACIAYVVIIADVLQPILALGAGSSASLLCERWPWQVLVVSVVIFPLCLLRRMDSLKYTSVAAVACILAFTLAVVVTGVRALADPALRDTLFNDLITGRDGGNASASATRCRPPSSRPEVRPPGSAVNYVPADHTVLNALPIVCFAFLCHMNAFPIYAELEGRSLARMRRVSRASMAVCAAVYLSSGLFGYAAFLGATQDNLMLDFATSGSALSLLMDALRVGFGVALVFSYPVVIYEARHGIAGAILQVCAVATGVLPPAVAGGGAGRRRRAAGSRA